MSVPAQATKGPRPHHKQRFHRLLVERVDTLGADATALTFRVPPSLREAYAFEPGQSLTVKTVIEGQEQRRNYSICSAVGTSPRIGVREVPGGLVSSWLVHRVRPGDEIEVSTPEGTFVADPDVPARHVIVAAGSGITPNLSIASSVLQHPDAQVTLIYGNRRADSVMFEEELSDLKDTYRERFEIIHVLSREPRSVELFSGRLDAERLNRILTALVPVHDVDHFWLCGPFGMVTAARDVLRALDVDTARIHQELFYVDEVAPVPRRDVTARADGAVSDVTVILDGHASVLRLPRDVPILDSAQRVRADLPFACKGGVCGTCRAKVTSGQVDMIRNYALEEYEVAAGFVLTCQSLPLSDAVAIDYDA